MQLPGTLPGAIARGIRALRVYTSSDCHGVSDSSYYIARARPKLLFWELQRACNMIVLT